MWDFSIARSISLMMRTLPFVILRAPGCLRTVEGQTPDPEWEARLDGMSSHFRKLKERVAGRIGRGTVNKGESA